MIDSTHNFNISNDNRRLVGDTGYYEYNGIGYVETTSKINVYNSSTAKNYVAYDNYKRRDSGAFIDDNVLITCAHAFYHEPAYYYQNATCLIKTFAFAPGVNSYPYGDDDTSNYGEYLATEAYVSVSYVLNFNYGTIEYKVDCASADWAIVFVQLSNSTPTYTHSNFGLLSFSGTTSSAVSVGYPNLTVCPSDDYYMYQYSMWANYPLQGSATVATTSNGFSYISSTYHKITKGNSGGPLYTRNTYVLNGQIHREVRIIGICSGGPTDASYNWFFRMTTAYVSLFREIMSYA